jgi:hypothetical protein
MSSISYTSAAAFQSYVQKYYDMLITELFFGFRTSALVTPHEGVKGRELITAMTIGALAKRYSKTFSPTADAINFIPRNLIVAPAKVDLEITPKDFESTYLGMARQPGQKSYDLPYEGQIISGIIAKVAQEMELAFWQAAAAGSPSNSDLLIALFDGVQEVIKDEIANLSPVATGAISNTNAVEAVYSVYKSIGKAYKDQGVDVFLSYDVYEKFIENYQATVSANFAHSDGIVRLPYNRNAQVHVLPGVPDNCILVTPKENLHYGYDAAMDPSFINFETETRNIRMWIDFNMGFNFGIVNPDIIALNDVWTTGATEVEAP